MFSAQHPLQKKNKKNPQKTTFLFHAVQGATCTNPLGRPALQQALAPPWLPPTFVSVKLNRRKYVYPGKHPEKGTWNIFVCSVYSPPK